MCGAHATTSGGSGQRAAGSGRRAGRQACACPLLAARCNLKLSASAELAAIRRLFVGTLLVAADVRAATSRLAIRAVADVVAALHVRGATAEALIRRLARPSAAVAALAAD